MSKRHRVKKFSDTSPAEAGNAVEQHPEPDAGGGLGENDSLAPESSSHASQSGLIRVRFRKRGDPYVLISREDAQALVQFGQNWWITMDFAASPPVVIVPESWRAPVPREKKIMARRRVTVPKDDWDWFVTDCRARGTSTCREVRAWIHLLREEAEYPVSLRRKPAGYEMGYVR